MQTTVGTFLALLMLFGAAQIFVSGQESELGDFREEKAERFRDSIVGAWRTALTQRNCQTGLPVSSAVGRGLVAFHEGGTLSEIVGSGRNPNSGQTRSPGYGVWEQQRHNRRSFSGVFVINRNDATGAFIGIQKVTATWELSTIGNRYTSNATVESFDANDNLTGTGCATSVGTRIE